MVAPDRQLCVRDTGSDKGHAGRGSGEGVDCQNCLDHGKPFPQTGVKYAVPCIRGWRKKHQGPRSALAYSLSR
ncbi:hypothetical protein M2226_001408 [Bradyrhizobium elkanii]|nr:hypothetical protein [Bradyrhizobium elkanii]MCW2169411.1 hypothetical protein [Bradyrhizobium elkanii]